MVVNNMARMRIVANNTALFVFIIMVKKLTTKLPVLNKMGTTVKWW